MSDFKVLNERNVESDKMKSAQHKLQESLSLLTATIESTADGILVVDSTGKVSAFNKKFLRLWHIPPTLVREQDDNKLIAHVLDQLTDPDLFLEKSNIFIVIQHYQAKISFTLRIVGYFSDTPNHNELPIVL
ncbi:MAG: PAS domain-containing protein [Flammeovirgaceae bacterium]|nr:PAS domain-containing protein [Flammeovirgaceae bacterium]